MCSDISSWCRACEICTSWQVGKPTLDPKSYGVDDIKFPHSSTGFMDYLTKWLEVFATIDQTSPTMAKLLLVEEIISQHGVPSEFLSDRETAFLSRLTLDVYRLMDITKTMAYHPQTEMGW